MQSPTPDPADFQFDGDYFLPPRDAYDIKLCYSVVIRLNVRDFERRYHIPLLIAPHNYTVWWSGTPEV